MREIQINTKILVDPKLQLKQKFDFKHYQFKKWYFCLYISLIHYTVKQIYSCIFFTYINCSYIYFAWLFIVLRKTKSIRAKNCSFGDAINLIRSKQKYLFFAISYSNETVRNCYECFLSLEWQSNSQELSFLTVF